MMTTSRMKMILRTITAIMYFIALGSLMTYEIAQTITFEQCLGRVTMSVIFMTINEVLVEVIEYKCRIRRRRIKQ